MYCFALHIVALVSNGYDNMKCIIHDNATLSWWLIKKMQNIDKMNIWHPFTVQKQYQDNVNIVSGDGAILVDQDGHEYIDLVSSWWCNLHGHSNKEIAEAIYSQAQNLEHVIFAGYTHNPAISLTDNILHHMPTTLNRVFFSDNGSTSVEVAMKVAFQYHRNLGDNRRDRFIAFNGGYHGDTFGAMSVSAQSGYHNLFAPMLCKCEYFDYPYITDKNVGNIAEIENEILHQLDVYLSKNSNYVVGLIIEPIIQGASGMRICRPEFIDRLLHLCRSHNIITICDEIMVGFYRTGQMFAVDHLSEYPDIICLSKGLTGGFLPLGMTIVSDYIYAAFYSSDINKTFLHGHTYTGNPISCAAANKSYEILMRDITKESIIHLSNFIKDNFVLLGIIPFVTNIRSFGCIGAFDITKPELVNDIIAKLKAKGLLMRPLCGTTLYWMPPYCITNEQLNQSFSVLTDTLKMFV